jgi:hypothetical protein
MNCRLLPIPAEYERDGQRGVGDEEDLLLRFASAVPDADM